MSGRYRGAKLRGSLVLDVARLGIDHGEEHADLLSMLLHRPIRCPARPESVALVGPAHTVVGGAAVFTLADGEPFVIDVEGEQHRPGPSRVHSGNGVGIVAATAGTSVHDSQHPRACAAHAAPAPRVDRPAVIADGCRSSAESMARATTLKRIGVRRASRRARTAGL